LAKDSLIDFTRYTYRDYRPAPHHRLIAEKLEAVERGEIKRLMIFMPPRHGKSELASIRFPAWFLGRNPTRSIIAASYNSDLSATCLMVLGWQRTARRQTGGGSTLADRMCRQVWAQRLRGAALTFC